MRVSINKQNNLEWKCRKNLFGWRRYNRRNNSSNNGRAPTSVLKVGRGVPNSNYVGRGTMYYYVQLKYASLVYGQGICVRPKYPLVEVELWQSSTPQQEGEEQQQLILWPLSFAARKKTKFLLVSPNQTFIFSGQVYWQGREKLYYQDVWISYINFRSTWQGNSQQQGQLQESKINSTVQKKQRWSPWKRMPLIMGETVQLKKHRIVQVDTRPNTQL